MSRDEAPAMVDAVYPLAGRSLARDHRLALALAVEAAAPWLRSLPAAGIHPVRLTQGADEVAPLSARARLLVRVPRGHDADLQGLCGAELDAGGHRLRLGPPHLRELVPHPTLYAYFVVADSDDEGVFLSRVDAQLDAMGVACERVCGRRQRIRGEGGAMVGFSLMLHGLSASDSRRVLEGGLGAARRLGCGVFVAHRSAAAVGS